MFNLLLDQARALLGRRYAHDSIQWRGQFGYYIPALGHTDYVWGRNRVVNQGINHLLNAGLRGEGVITQLYIAPYVADIIPAATVTAANFNSTLTEFTNYDEAARPQWVSDAAATAQMLENAADPALFTIGAGVQTTINGAGLLSVSSKGSTSGILVAAAKSPSTFSNLAQGFEVKIKYRITGTSP